MAPLNQRECFGKVMAGEATEWVPNYELGVWGQTVERWHGEGLPQDRSFVGRLDMFEGEPLFGPASTRACCRPSITR